MVGVNAFAHLYRKRNFTGSLYRSVHNCREKVSLPRQGCSPAFSGNLWDWTSKVQINVIGTVLGNQHGDGLRNSLWVYTIELNGTYVFTFVMAN
jgi:hypothetical protein